MRVITDLREFDARPWHVRAVQLGIAAVFLWLLTAILPGCTRVVYRDAPTAPALIATPEPTPAPACRFPQGLASYETFPGRPELYAELNAAMSVVLECPVETECRWPGYDPQTFFAQVTRHLLAQGLCAGQPVDGISDELVVGRTCAGEWEVYHAWAYGGRPLWARPRETKCVGTACGGAYRGNAFARLGGCS